MQLVLTDGRVIYQRFSKISAGLTDSVGFDIHLEIDRRVTRLYLAEFRILCSATFRRTSRLL